MMPAASSEYHETNSEFGSSHIVGLRGLLLHVGIPTGLFLFSLPTLEDEKYGHGHILKAAVV